MECETGVKYGFQQDPNTKIGQNCMTKSLDTLWMMESCMKSELKMSID